MSLLRLHGQPQLSVEGHVDSEDTVAIINVNSNAMFSDIVGLHVFSHPTPGRGVGGSFYGGLVGLRSESRQTAILGRSQNAWGVFSESTNGSAGYFRGGSGKMDIVLGGSEYGSGSGGDEGVIGVISSKPSGDLFLVSNDAVILQLDNNDDENGHLVLKNGDGDDVLIVNESGYITFADGTQQTSAAYKSNYSEVEVGTATGSSLLIVGQWVGLGSPISFNKLHDDTSIEVIGNPFATTIVNSGGNVSFEFRINGAKGEFDISERLLSGRDGKIFMKSIFTKLAAGTHSFQVYARANAAPATLVRLDQGSQILIEEQY